MRVLVAGATGAIGKALIPRLIAAGHETWALASSERRVADLAKTGAAPVVADALDAAAVRAALEGAEPEIVVNELTRIPARIDPRRAARDLADTCRLRREGTANLSEAASRVGARRLISQSIAFAYKPRPGGPWTEDDPLNLDAPGGFSEIVAAAATLESLTLKGAGRDGVVLRYGLFYGPGTVYAADGTMAEDVRRRKIPIVGDGRGLFSFVSLDDAADATVRALTGPAGVYNIVDDSPVAAGDWLREYAAMIGARPPFRVPRWLGRLAAGPYVEYLMLEQKGASNARARERLGWRPATPSWRAGFAAMFGAAAARG